MSALSVHFSLLCLSFYSRLCLSFTLLSCLYFLSLYFSGPSSLGEDNQPVLCLVPFFF
jgi:hypothetical protein